MSFEENNLQVKFNNGYKIKVATYDETLDFNRNFFKIGFQLRLEADQNFVEDIYNAIGGSDITSIEVYGQDGQLLRKIENKSFQILNVIVGFFLDPSSIERTKGILNLGYPLVPKEK